MQKKRGRWSGFLYMPQYTCCAQVGAQRKEAKIITALKTNKETNNCLGSEALAFHLAAQRLRSVMSI